MPNLAYYDSTAKECVKKSATTCTTLNTECYDYAGYICTASACGCDTTKWSDTAGICQWLKRLLV